MSCNADTCECSCHCGGFEGGTVCKQPCDKCDAPDREFIDSKQDKTHFVLETGFGSVHVLVQSDHKAYIESSDRVRTYTDRGLVSGSPLMIKNIDYSCSGHAEYKNGEWKCDTRYFSVYGINGNVTETRKKKVIGIIEKALREWRDGSPGQMAVAFHAANLIGVNNEIYYAEGEVREAKATLAKLLVKLYDLEQRESELKVMNELEAALNNEKEF